MYKISDKQISIYNIVSIYTDLPISIMDELCLKNSLKKNKRYRILFRANSLNQENLSHFIINECQDKESLKILILKKKSKLKIYQINFIKMIFKIFGKKFFIFKYNDEKKIEIDQLNKMFKKIILKIENI